jgi:mannosyltransferase
VQPERRGTETVYLSVAAAAIAATLGLITLGRRSLWMDEAIDVDYTRQAWGDYLRTAFHHEGSQALYLLILKPWIALTSTDDWVARLPSVVFAALAVGLLVALAIRVFESRFVGIAAGLILATSVTSVSWSQQARQYALAMLLAVAVTYLFVWAVESDRLVPWLVYGAVAGISIYAHFFVGLVVASHVVALVCTWRRVVVTYWAIAAGLALLIALPGVDFVLYHDSGQVSWIPSLTYDHVRSTVHQAAGGSWWPLPAVGAVGLVLLVVEAVRRRSLAWRYVLVASWLVVPVVLAIAISYFKPLLVERYLIVSVPALALAAAYALSRLGPRIGTVALAVVLAASLTHVRDWYRAPYPEDWRGAVQYVDRTKQPDEQLLVYPGWLSAPVVHYTSSNVDTSETPTAERAWVVTYVDRVGEAQGWLDEAGYSVEKTLNFGQVYVLQLAKRSPA